MILINSDSAINGGKIILGEECGSEGSIIIG